MESEGLDFIYCNRLPLNNRNAISMLRRLGIYILNLEVLFLYGWRANDILSGMWGMKKSTVKKMKLKMVIGTYPRNKNRSLGK